MTPKRIRGTLCALLGGACWGFSGTLGQYLFSRKGMESSWLTVVRMLGAGMVLLAVSYARRPKKTGKIWRRRPDAVRLLLFAVIGLMPCQLTYLTAISYSNSATATALQYLGQALILLYTCLSLRRSPTGRELCALLLALIGVFLLATHGSIHSLVLSPRALGWGLGAAVSSMLYTLIPGRMISSYGSTVVTGWGMLLGGGVLLLLSRAWHVSVSLDFGALVGVAVIVLVGTALAFTLYLQGVGDLGGVNASLLACSEPVVAAVLTAVWLKTQLTIEDVGGIVLIIAMVVILAFSEKGNATEEEKSWDTKD